MCRKWLPLIALIPDQWPAVIGLRPMNGFSSILSTSFSVNFVLRHFAAGLLSVNWYKCLLMHSISKTHHPDNGDPIRAAGSCRISYTLIQQELSPLARHQGHPDYIIIH